MSIRVLIVDDSSLVRGFLRAILEREPDIEVVGEASNGRRAVEMTQALRPSLVTMDLEMPVMHGLEAIAEIMCTKAVPILVASSYDDAANACEALRLGALDVIAKPDHSTDTIAEFIAKVRLLADIVVMTRWSQQPAKINRLHAAPMPLLDAPPGYRHLVAIAASTGGPQALLQILAALPPEFSCPIIIAQHIAEGFSAGLAEWLALHCALPVRLVTSGESLSQGVVYLVPSEYNAVFDAQARIQLQQRAANDIYRPNCDQLLGSVAHVFGPRAVGIILTGMSSDGAWGMRQIHERGGITLAQDEHSSVVYGMNRVAIESGVIDQVLPLDAVASTLWKLIRCLQ